MQHVILYAHPNPKSFSATICDHLGQLSQDLGNTVDMRDLYKMNFNPVLSASDFNAIRSGKVPSDIAVEQKAIKNADLISLIFPLWWTGYPAILKGWIDRVLLNGFAYQHAGDDGIKPLLTGKRIQIITTMGAAVDEYEENGLMDAMAMTMGDNVWSFCGCDDAGMIVLGEVPGMSDSDRRAMLSEIEDSLVAALSANNLTERKQKTSGNSAKKSAKAKSGAAKKAKNTKSPKKAPKPAQKKPALKKPTQKK